MTRLRAAVLALGIAVVATVAVRSIGDDIMRAWCAGIGKDHPLYVISGCPAYENNSPEGD